MKLYFARHCELAPRKGPLGAAISCVPVCHPEPVEGSASSHFSLLTSRPSSGFTLIELLIASSIFASLMLISVSTFTKMNQLNDRSSTIRSLSETGRFVMEDLARAVSSATGNITVNLDGSSSNDQPVRLLNQTSQQVVDLSTGLAIAPTQLVVVQSDDANVVSCALYYVDNTSKQLMVKKYSSETGLTTQPQPLTTPDVEVIKFSLSGVPPLTSSTNQPYVSIGLQLKALTPRGTQPVQEFKTSIVLRDYAFTQRTSTTHRCLFPSGTFNE